MDAGGRYDPCDRGCVHLYFLEFHASVQDRDHEGTGRLCQPGTDQSNRMHQRLLRGDDLRRTGAGSDWYALADETDQAEMEALAEKADVQIRSQKISPACDFHYVCYTVCNLLWDCVGNLETLREIPDWKEKTALPGVREKPCVHSHEK